MRKGKNKKRTSIAWSEDEVKLIKRLFPQGRAEEIAKRTGRPLASVQQKAYSMGIRTTEYRPWSATEVRLLKKLYRDENAQSIADRLGRTVWAVTAKARKLGLAGKVRVWSKKELNLLERLYPSKTARETAEQIGRSKRATLSKIQRLGLRKKSKYEQSHRVVRGTREKLCGECKKWKAESQFCINRRPKDRLQWQCKECEAKCARKHYKAIRKRVRKYLRYEDRHRVAKGAKHKLCRKCNHWVNETGFHKRLPEKDGLAGRCKKCACKAAAKSYERKRKGARRYLRYDDCHRIVDGVRQKLCGKCRKWKSESDFYKSRARRDGLTARCQQCFCKPAGNSRKK